MSAAELYLDLLKGCLTRSWLGDDEIVAAPARTSRLTRRRGSAPFVRSPGHDPAKRRVGLDWPATAETMVGWERLSALQACVETALAEDVPGDLIETGVWRGGSAILMRGVLEAHGDTTRTVWCADSFAGLPEPDAATYPADAGDTHHGATPLAVSRAEVEANFARYRLSSRVRYLEGWFRDTLPSAPIDRLCVARLDGDMYASTIQALDALYPRLSPGGFLVVDDYGAVPGCRQAVTEFREAHGITEPLVQQDWTGVHWRRER